MENYIYKGLLDTFLVEIFSSLTVVFISCSSVRDSVSLENDYTHDLLSVNYQKLPDIQTSGKCINAQT